MDEKESELQECSTRVGMELAEIKAIAKEILYETQKKDPIASALNNLADKISLIINEHSKMVPIKTVYLLFLLVFGMVLGIEAVRHLFKLGSAFL